MLGAVETIRAGRVPPCASEKAAAAQSKTARHSEFKLRRGEAVLAKVTSARFSLPTDQRDHNETPRNQVESTEYTQELEGTERTCR